MTTGTDVDSQEGVSLNAMSEVAAGASRRRRRIAAALSFRNISAVYIWLLLMVVFSVWVPETFLTSTTLKSVLAQESVTAMLAIGLVLPLAAGLYDLSIGYALGTAQITVAWMMAIQHQSPLVSIAFALAIGLGVGILNGFLVVKAHINSFIATLAVGSGLAAVISWLSGDTQIIDLDQGFQRLGTNQFLGLSWPVYYLVILAVVLWYFTEHTPTGRYLFATGGNPEAARLAGVRTSRMMWGALIACATIATFAGIVATARVGAGSPGAGPPYLIPAFAAAFVGATQFKGRPNIWGTVVAVYVLATGVKGLQLAGAPIWLPDLFNCIALLLAVGLFSSQARPRSQRRRWFGLRLASDTESQTPRS